MSSACSGCCGAAQANIEWIAASRRFRVRAVLPLWCSRWWRKLVISGALRSAKSSSEGALPVWAAAKQQEPPGGAVGADGVATGLELPHQPVGEERLQGGREQRHDCPAREAPPPWSTWACSRGAEIAALTLEDVDWRSGIVMISGKAAGATSFPFPATSPRRSSPTCGTGGRPPRLTAGCSSAAWHRTAA